VVKEEEGFWIAQRRIIEDSIGKFEDFLQRAYEKPTINRYLVERGVEEPLDEKSKLYSGQV
jgi:hypothetical protein